MNIAIITARGGSKRIPRKNIKNFLGKPIIAYSIEAALKSDLFDEVMVSTDDVEIAEIAQKFGAIVPFFRSSENADDFSTTADVLIEVLSRYQQEGKVFEFACCMYPTAPFISDSILKKAHNLLVDKNLDSIFPVQKFGFPVQRALTLKNEKLAWLHPENAAVRSQDLEPTFHDTGQFYFFRTASFLKTKTLLGPNTSGIEVSEMDAHDIDNEEDWKVAEFKYRIKHNL
ncbi:N-acylneuraminate cytidylyltransferase [Pseudarcicella hirudinis]|uniref:N-acylneuraminate cytidylyltransferase n=1 Tax=Pseudarcicella hirudinis TaxID=1079859 RepID=A0A1I5UC63_9BACT|nr:pseudaminic acid cytidylyltransferase [Pseudarcicella hirudinis]SFP92890.1 N-acylneuraminate cytidylyltransferase [Pseudarcicella hirudinis]